jgi:RNA polymerase sigma-70 factor, ECF subfamily
MAESLCARDSFIETPVDLLAYSTEPRAVEKHELSGGDQRLQALLDAARHGSPDAHHELLKSLRPMVFRWFQRRVSRRMRSKVDADDLTQDALVRAWIGFADFRGLLIQQYRAWLKVISKHGLQDTRKFAGAERRAAERETALDEQGVASGAVGQSGPAPAADARLCAAETSERLARALAQLRAGDRDAFLRHELRHESFADIGRRRGCCANTALAACRRARGQLASDLIELRYAR